MDFEELLKPVVAALAKEEVTLLPAQVGKLKAMVTPLADSDAKAVMDALAAHVTLHGLASAAQQPIRNAITGSEPDVESIINSNIDGGAAAFESWFSDVATNLAK